MVSAVTAQKENGRKIFLGTKESEQVFPIGLDILCKTWTRWQGVVLGIPFIFLLASPGRIPAPRESPRVHLEQAHTAV